METTEEKEPKKRGRKPQLKEATKGNKTHLLDDSHPMKDYSFNTVDEEGEKILFNKGLEMGIDDVFHVYFVPWEDRRKGTSDGKPFVQKFEPSVWKKRLKTFEAYSEPRFDKIEILHDPNFKG